MREVKASSIASTLPLNSGPERYVYRNSIFLPFPTDAALVDHATGSVLCGAKALTTRRDLAIGIGQASDSVFH